MVSHPKGSELSSPRRRASLQTKFFSLPTTSDYFKEKNFKPTKIVGMILLSDPNPDVSRIQTLIIDKMLKVPRFRSVCRLEDGHTIFEPIVDMDQFDMDYHLKVVNGLGKMTEQDGSDLVSEAHLMNWDATKPLWKLTLVKNMIDGRSMLLCVIDHALGDGASLSAVMLSLFDKKPIKKTGESTSQKSHRPYKTKVRLSHRIVSFLYGSYAGFIGLHIGGADPENGLKIPLAKKRCEPAGKKCTQTKHFPLSEIKAMKNKLPGTTINDIVMGIATIAIQDYFEKTNDPVLHKIKNGGKNLHLQFTVNYRDRNTTMEDLVANTNNRLVVGQVSMPIGVKSPIDVVWDCKAQMDEFKISPVIAILWNVGSFLLRFLPDSAIEEAALDSFSKATACMTNIMGPAEASSIAGYLIDDFSFLGTGHGQSLYLGVISYNNRVRITVCMDELVQADPQEFKKSLEVGYTKLNSCIMSASPEELNPPDQMPKSAKVLEALIPILAIGLIGWLVKSLGAKQN
eukprot:CAMPEP_0198286010 /NCGR_PEP_ID=MMETSP1449-20131203/5195_1 /TAXON_ID=420275 /ORGANISM="Attheya septentrionalis, Strain CCMP2084" /LENGTH=512 /DNA_ID=CAMNT_0043983629 /DNA_START=122 /DNA_END=1660 /DNA_ORIENTATION=-